MEPIIPKFEDLYHQYHSPIARYMTQMVGLAEAADVTQEVFAKIDRGLKHFEGRASLSTWIYRIATNTALDWLRKAQSKRPEIPLVMEAVQASPSAPEAPVPSEGHSPLHQVIHSEMNDCIRQQVDKLPEKYRTVMVLSSLEELNNQEVAAILEISVDAVKIRLHRARDMVKKILERVCRFYSNPASGALACDRKTPPRS